LTRQFADMKIKRNALRILRLRVCAGLALGIISGLVAAWMLLPVGPREGRPVDDHGVPETAAELCDLVR